MACSLIEICNSDMLPESRAITFIIISTQLPSHFDSSCVPSDREQTHIVSDVIKYGEISVGRYIWNRALGLPPPQSFSGKKTALGAANTTQMLSVDI